MIFYTQRLCKNTLYNEFIELLFMRRGVETPGNIPETPCVGVYTMVEKNNYNHIEGNHEGTYID